VFDVPSRTLVRTLPCPLFIIWGLTADDARRTLYVAARPLLDTNRTDLYRVSYDNDPPEGGSYAIGIAGARVDTNLRPRPHKRHGFGWSGGSVCGRRSGPSA
jgi:hypothetical protein